MLNVKQLLHNPSEYYLNLKRRCESEDTFNLLLPQLKQRGRIMNETQTHQADLNKQTKLIPLIKEKEKKQQAILELKELKLKLQKKEAEMHALLKKTNDLLLSLPNYLDEKVPFGISKDENLEIFENTNGQNPLLISELSHLEIASKLDILDMKRAAKMSGARFALYKKDGALLMRALSNYFLQENIKKSYQEMIVPTMVSSASLYHSGQLPKFAEDLFKVEKSHYLIPTSEVSLVNMHANEIIKEDVVRYTAFSDCYRSEAGSGGKDNKGVIRLHQFRKVELVGICRASKAKEEFRIMQDQVEHLLESLGLPFRKILLCSADTGFTSAITYDYEIWIPSENKYRETSSVSWIKDFQARRSLIRYKNEDNTKEFAHTLNGSALALDRVFASIVENNYDSQSNKIKVPKVLVPFVGKEYLSK